MASNSNKLLQQWNWKVKSPSKFYSFFLSLLWKSWTFFFTYCVPRWYIFSSYTRDIHPHGEYFQNEKIHICSLTSDGVKIVFSNKGEEKESNLKEWNRANSINT